MDAQNGTVITSLDIGRGSDGCAFDPTLRRAYSSNGEGTLTIVQEEDANTFSVLNTIQTKIGARTIYNNAETHHLYLPTAELGPAPAATTEIPYPRPTINPGTFVILEIAPEP